MNMFDTSNNDNGDSTLSDNNIMYRFPLESIYYLVPHLLVSSAKGKIFSSLCIFRLCATKLNIRKISTFHSTGSQLPDKMKHLQPK